MAGNPVNPIHIQGFFAFDAALPNLRFFRTNFLACYLEVMWQFRDGEGVLGANLTGTANAWPKQITERLTTRYRTAH